MTLIERLEALSEPDREMPPLCADLDEDCDEVDNKLRCWLYDPIKGRCPFLSRKEC